MIDIEFVVEEVLFKAARLARDETGVADVTEAGVREAVTSWLIEVGWAERGLAPCRCTVMTRPSALGGGFLAVVLPAEAGVIAAE